MTYGDHLVTKPASESTLLFSENGVETCALDDLAQMIGHQVALHANAHRPYIADTLGLALADYSALEFIIGFGSLSTGQISRLTGLSTGGTTALLNRLEEAGYINRHRHQADRRIITVEPVAGRCEPVRNLTQRCVDDVLRMTMHCNPVQIHTTRDLLKRCLHVMQMQTRNWLKLEDTEPPRS